jgi:hypothetical protein
VWGVGIELATARVRESIGLRSVSVVGIIEYQDQLSCRWACKHCLASHGRVFNWNGILVASGAV